MMLPFERFVRQVSNGVLSSCYGNIGMMNKNAVSIISTPWKRAVCDKNSVSLTVSQISRTDGVFDGKSGTWSRYPTYTAWIDDKYDAFAQGGDGVITDALMCGYLGCVAYRFMLPTINNSALKKVWIAVQRDRFLRAGVKISVEVSNRETPSDDWYGVIHPSSASGDVIYCTESEPVESGTVGVSSWGFMGQKDVPYLTKSRAAMDVLKLDDDSVSALENTAGKKYLYVYITLEDPSSYWEMYSEKEKRLYNIEGSAMLVHSVCDFEFSGEEEAGFPEESGCAAIRRFYTMRDGLVSATVPTNGKITDVSPYIFYSGCMSGFIALPDRSKLLSLSFERCLKEMPRVFLHGVNNDSGLDLNDSSDSDVGIIEPFVCWGNPKAFISIPSMEVFGGWPSDYNGEPTRIMVLSKMCPNKNGDMKPQIASLAGSGSAVSAVRGYMQFVFGYAVVEAPAGKKSYSKIRIASASENEFHITGNLSVSLNVWHSKSMSCTGMYSNMAIAALAENPALFVDGDKNISAEATFPIMDYESHRSVDNVSVSAEASLIAEALSVNVLESDEILIEGVDIAPGDMIIIAPRVDSISYVDGYEDGFAFFGAESGKPEREAEYTPQYNSGLELEVSFY